MKLKPILYMLVVFALFVSACGADTGTENNGNTATGANANYNGNENYNGVTNANYNGITNENFNSNLNANLNTNANLNANGSLSSNENFNTNGNLNGNLNANENFNANTNSNFNGAATTAPFGTPAATSALPNTGATPAATTATGGIVATATTTATLSSGYQSTPATGALGTPSTGYQSTPSTGALSTPSSGGTGVLPNTGLPAQSQRAEIRGQREQLAALSNIVGYQLVSASGKPIGTVTDFIINTCETYIVYMVVNPVSGVGPGGTFLVPFEAVTINSGAIDASARNIVINMTPEQFAKAPAFPANTQLSSTQWEAAVREFYKPLVRVSNLSSECRVQGGPTNKIAYASQLLQAQVREGNGQVLGVVRQATLEPESGKVDFVVVELTPPGQNGVAPAQGQGQGQGLGQGRLTLVPMAAVNIPDQAYAQGGPVWLVLLTPTDKLMSAPLLTSIDQAYNFDVQNAARQYWGQPLMQPGTFNTPGQPLQPENPGGNSNSSGTGTGNGNGSGGGNGNGSGYTKP